MESTKLTESIESINKNLDLKADSKEVKELKAQQDNDRKEWEAKVEKLNVEHKGSIEKLEDNFKELKAKQGKAGSYSLSGGVGEYRTTKSLMQAAIKDAVEKNYDALFIKQDKTPIKLDYKTQGSIILSSNLSNDNFISYLPAAQRPFGRFRFRDLVSTYQSNTNFIQYARQDPAPHAGSFDFQNTENTTKQQLDYTWSMQTLNLEPLAGFAKVSEQSLQNIPFLSSMLPQNLLEDLLNKEDSSFSTALLSAANGALDITGGVTGMEKILDYITNLEATNYDPNCIVIDPAMWTAMLRNKSTDGIYTIPNVVSIDANGTTQILGLPVYRASWLKGTGKVIVGDFNPLTIGIVESTGLQFNFTNSDGTDFLKNSLTYRLERTEGLAVFRPDAFIAQSIA